MGHFRGIPPFNGTLNMKCLWAIGNGCHNCMVTKLRPAPSAGIESGRDEAYEELVDIILLKLVTKTVSLFHCEI